MNVTTSTILLDKGVADRLGRHVHRTLNNVQAGMERVHAGDTKAAQSYLLEASETMQEARQTLRAEGVADLDDLPDALDMGSLPVVTPSCGPLLQAVAEARELAYAVDRERGHVLANGMPCGLADTFDDLFYRLKLEMEGPTGLE